MAVYTSGLGGETAILLTPPLLNNYKVEFVPTGTFISFPATKLAGYTYHIKSCRKISASFMFKNRQEFKNFRDFFVNRKGQLLRFWLPCWQNEFELTRNVNVNDGILYIKNVNQSQKEDDYLRIFIVKKSGDIVVKHVTEVITIDETEEKFVLDSPIPIGIQTSEVVFFGRVILARFNSDLEVKFLKADNTDLIATASVSFIEVPYEYSEVGV
jgi:hypothetical protein